MRSKTESLIGFAIKARKVTYGLDNIEVKKGIKLIIYSIDISENSLKRLKKVAENAKIPLVLSRFPLENIVYKQGVKTIAITDKQMSQAIINNISDSFEVVFDYNCIKSENNGKTDGCKINVEDKPVD